MSELFLSVPGPAPRLVPFPPGLPVVEREGDARLLTELLHGQLEAVHNKVVAARVVLVRSRVGVVIPAYSGMGVIIHFPFAKHLGTCLDPFASVSVVFTDPTHVCM